LENILIKVIIEIFSVKGMYKMRGSNTELTNFGSLTGTTEEVRDVFGLKKNRR
jgi:hypothetical protein